MTLNTGLDRTHWPDLICLLLHCGLIHGDEDIIEKQTEHVLMPLYGR